MAWLMLALALVVAPPDAARPALGSAAHEIRRVPHPELRARGLLADRWEQRALVRRADDAVVVRGPRRKAPTIPTPTIAVSASEAVQRVAAEGWPGAATPTLVVTRRGALAWRVDPPASLAGPSNPVFLVHATSGRTWVRHDRVRTETVGAFPSNPIATPRAQSFELLDFDAAAAGGNLVGTRIAAVNCVPPTGEDLCDYETIAPTDRAGNFGHPIPDIDNPDDNVQLQDAFAVQSVHHHAEVMLAYLDTFGIPPVTCLAQGQPLVLLANYKAYLGDGSTILIANAGYVGDCALAAVFGQGPQADYGYDGDVIYHELTHAAIEALMEGGLLGLPRARSEGVVRDAGALGEGLADFIAAVVSGDPVHAEYVNTLSGATARTLANDLTCPASLTGEVHFDGEIFGAALWDIYVELGDPFVGAVFDMIALLPEDATFEEAATTLRQVIDAELGASAADVAQAQLNARGLLDCPRLIAWDALQRPLWLRPRGQGGTFDPLQPPPAQLAVALPVGAVGFMLRFEVQVRATPGFAPITELHALVKSEAPVTFTYSDTDDGITVVDADPDVHLPRIDADVAAEGLWVAAPGGVTTYLALFNQSPNVTLISNVEIDIVMGTPGADSGGTGGGPTTTGDAGGEETGAQTAGGADQRASDGCQCRHAPAAPPAWMMLCVGLWVRRRRRRSMTH